MGRLPLWRRYKRIARGHGFDVASLGDSLLWRSFPKFRLTQPDAEDVLCRVGEGSVICITDSLKAMIPGIDENDARYGDYLGIFSRVSEKIGTLFMPIHHEGKPPTEGKREAQYRGRGTSAIQGWISSQWSITKEPDHWLLEHGKTEHGEAQEPLRVRLIDVGERETPDAQSPGVRFIPYQDEASARPQAVDANREIAHRILTELGREACGSADAMARRLGARAAAVRDAWEILKRSGMIEASTVNGTRAFRVKQEP